MNTTKTKDLSQFNQDHLRDKLYSKTDRSSPDQCWNWNGARKPEGYGLIMIEKQMLATHRISYHLHNGPIPKGMLVCHTCDNPRCVNPNHLFAGTHQDNVNDMIAKKRNAFGEKQGHAKLSDEKVLAIRTAWAGRLTQTKLAKQFGISASTLHQAIYGSAWTHIKSLNEMNRESNESWTADTKDHDNQ